MFPGTMPNMLLPHAASAESVAFFRRKETFPALKEVAFSAPDKDSVTPMPSQYNLPPPMPSEA